MAQGMGKLSGKRRASSGGAQKRKVAKKRALKKGRKSCHVKGRKNNLAAKVDSDTTKAINRKNEALVAAKAVSVGTKFFLKDIKETGVKEVKKQLNDRNRKEKKATKVSDRLKVQLKKIRGEC